MEKNSDDKSFLGYITVIIVVMLLSTVNIEIFDKYEPVVSNNHIYLIDLKNGETHQLIGDEYIYVGKPEKKRWWVFNLNEPSKKTLKNNKKVYYGKTSSGVSYSYTITDKNKKNTYKQETTTTNKGWAF